MFLLLLVFGLPDEETTSVEPRVEDDLGESDGPYDRFMDPFDDYRDGKRKRRPPPNCTAPNTRPSYDRKCICNETYFGDDPVGERGCWKCTPKCHSQAKCAYPGRCVCEFGLVGDGISECEPRLPTLLRIESISSGLTPDYIAAYYSDPFEFIPFSAFCKFNEIIVNAAINSNQSIKCLIPLITENVQVSISFNGINWTDSKMLDHIPKKFSPKSRSVMYKINPKKSEISFTFQYIVMVCAAILSLVPFIIPKIGDTHKKKNRDQLQPLIHHTTNNTVRKRNIDF